MCYSTWEEALKSIGSVVSNEYKRHKEILSSPDFNENDRKYYDRIVSEQCSVVELGRSLEQLSGFLKSHYGESVVIIIDEYDTPILNGHIKGFYDDVISFMRNFLSGGLKDNKNLTYGFMSGVLRMPQESIFSGLNNLTINSVIDSKYSEYFGFTADEVKKMAHYYNADDKYDEICEWYDGYRFGSTDIFNPWSVINYFRNNCQPSVGKL